MKKQKSHPVTIIKKSCTTGKIVWVYRGKSHEAGRKAYYRIKKKENTRVRWWKNRIKRRAQDIRAFLQKLIDGLPILGELTKEQRKAISDIQRLADNPPECDTGFYNHIQRERKRRAADREIRRKMRERENNKNINYDK